MKRLFELIFLLWSVSLAACGLFNPKLPSGQMPAPTSHDHFVTVNGLNLHYTEYPGEGDHVVLQHGFGASTYTWEALAKILNQRGYHVWALDLKGFGWSDKPLESDYDAVALMEDVNNWMAAIGVSDAVFVGNSLGGAIAVLLSKKYPQRVEKMVLIDAGGYPMEKPTVIKLAQLPLSNFFAQLIFGPWMIRQNLNEVFYDKEKVTKEKVQEYYLRTCTQNGLAALIKTARSIDFDKDNPIAEAAQKNPTPTLIIWGREDQWIPLDVGRQFKKDMSNATMTIIEACGHIPQEEKPQETARLILEFVEGRSVEDTGF